MKKLALLLLAIALPLYAYKFTHKTDYTDFDVYYRAGLRFVEGRFDEIYSLADGASPFRYSPPFLLILAPIAMLPLEAAKLVWFALQSLGYAGGFLALALALEACGIARDRRRWILAASFLLVLRVILDSWTIGQVTGLMFLGFGVSLWGMTTSRLGWASAGLFLPAFLKIGPGFSYVFLFLEALKLRAFRRVLLPPLALLGSSAAALWAIVPAEVATQLWFGWLGIVQGDSSYYDASHYGSQSLKSFLLRALPVEAASFLWLVLGATICVGLVLLLLSRSTASPRARFLLYSVSFFPTLLVMPETFKYSLTTLAYPIAAALAFGGALPGLIATAAFISIPGLDIVGKTVFFAIQRASLPLAAMFVLAILLMRRARALPARASFEPVPLPEVTNEPPEPGSALLIVYSPDALTAEDHRLTDEIAARLRPRYANLEIRHVSERPRLFRELSGARHARIFYCPIEQPCASDFFAEAGALLESGADWVRADRRARATRFVVPVLHLPLAYRRHRMGVTLNSILRALFGHRARDVLSMNWAMDARLARRIANLSTTQTLLAPLEWQLIAQAHQARIEERSCRFLLRTEKASPRLLLEFASIAWELPRIWLANLRGHYAPLPAECLRNITADDWGLSPGVNAGILSLARAGVVRRASVMANEPYVKEGLAELLKVPDIELGLHFNLSHGVLAHAPTRDPGSWMKVRASAETKRLIQAELRAQLELAKQAGVPIRYLDGHHHIHLVPGWLEWLAPTLEEYGIRRVRVPFDWRLLATSKAPLAILAWLAIKRARRAGFEALPCRYPSSRQVADPQSLKRVLRAARGAEVITHPAAIADLATIASPDSYNEPRLLEWRSLWSMQR